jgi:branched-chain amino acid transport system substrate-binding protein
MRHGKWSVYGVLISVLLLTIPTQVAAAGKIKIGVISPMNFMQGRDAWDGATLAAEEINKSGGITVKGVKYEIELVKADSNEFASVPDAISAFERLITLDKVNFVVGGFRSEATLAQQELLAQYKIIYLNTGSAAPDLTARVKQNYDKYKYYFRANSVNSVLATPPVSATLQVVMDKLKTQLGIQKPNVGLIMQKARYIDAMVDPVQKIVAALGGKVVGLWRPSATAPTLVAELSAAKEANAHLCFITFDGPAGVITDKEWGAMKFPFVNTGYNSEAQTKQHWEATNGYCEYSTNLGWIARSNITKANAPFWDEYVKRYNRFPSVYSATHSAINVLKVAIEKAGTMGSDILVGELEKIDYPTSYFRQVFYQKDQKFAHDTIIGAGHSTGYVMQWIKGELKVVWPDGKPLQTSEDAQSWRGIRYEGTVDYRLPPWVVEYWKDKK